MDLVITIIGHASERAERREHLLPKGTTDLIVDALADAGITVDQIDASPAGEDLVSD